MVLNKHLKEHAHENNRTHQITRKDNVVLSCKVCDEISSQKRIFIENYHDFHARNKCVGIHLAQKDRNFFFTNCCSNKLFKGVGGFIKKH